jgi:hypothetical protein
MLAPPSVRSFVSVAATLAAAPRPAIVDAARWPWVRIVLYEASPELIDPFIDSLLALAKRGPFVTVADATKATVVDAKTRKRFFDGLQRVQDTGSWRAEAIVIDDPLLRGIVTAYSWVRKAKAPLGVFSSVPAAEEWMKVTLPRVLR